MPKSFSPEKTERTTKKEHEAMIKTKTAIELIILTTCNLLLEKKYFSEINELTFILKFFSFAKKRPVFYGVFCFF